MKYALVTGGSRGLGRAVCLKLAKMGIPVLINYQSNVTAAEEVKTLVQAEGVDAELIRFDVASKTEADEVLACWEAEHPDDYIAYLVNNAGIRRDNVMFMMPETDWHEVLDVSLNGFFYVTRFLLPKMMMRKHGGRIVNMASLSGLKGMPGQVNYSAAKAALIGATKALAQEVALRNVTVNAVAPGFIETDMTNVLADQVKENILNQIPLKRMGTANEVAKLVKFLSSEDSKYITGQVINVDGGMVMA